MRRILTFIALLFALNATAQIQKIDSLTKELDNYAQKDSFYISLLNELAYTYQARNSDSSLVLGFQALQLAQELELENLEAWSLNRIGGAYWMKGQFPVTFKYLLEALTIFKQLNDLEGIGQSYNNIANTYNMEGEPEKSLDYYAKSIEIYEKLGNSYFIARAYANISRTHYKIGDMGIALEFADSAIYILENNERIKSSLYTAILNTKGDILQKSGKYDDALSLYLRALSIAEELQIPRLITYSTRGISEVYRAKNNLDESNEFALRTLELSKKIGYRENVKNAALIISNNSKQVGNFTKAYEYYLIHTAVKDSMFSQKKEQEIKSLQESYEVAKRQKEIELLEKDNALQKAKNDRQKLVVYGLIVVVLLSIAIAVTQYRNSQIIKKANRILIEQKNKLSEQNYEIIQQKEEIQSQAELLKEANKTKDKLFSIVSHDLKSPFNSLLSITENLDKQIFSPEDLTNFKIKLSSRVKALNEMLNNLLYWGKSQMQGLKTEKTSFSLSTLISKYLDVFSVIAAEKEIIIINN